MATTTVRVDVAVQHALRDLARERGETISAVLEQAVEHYRRQLMFEQANAAWAAMRADETIRNEELEERRLWEATLMDGIEDEE
jgi:predicted transcriptional regulator